MSSGRPLAVVLLSGGMDSTVAAAEVARTHRLACLHATYGQRTAARERVSFGALALHFRAETKLVIRLDALVAIGGSALTDISIPVAEARPDASAGVDRGDIPATYVPFRNAHLLAAAVSWAEVLGARAVVIGAVEEDSSGYPDCRRTFLDAYQQAVRLGTRPETEIELMAPVIDLSKAAIVRRGLELEAPFHLSWSCYTSESRACGRCESCRLRLQGFAAAGVEDPIPYADHDGIAIGGAPRAGSGDSGAAENPRTVAGTAAGRPEERSHAGSPNKRQVRALRAWLERVRRS